MFIVAWQGTPPPDKADWIRILRDVLANELGSYRIVFRRTTRGWRFNLDWREDERAREEGLVANSPEGVAYNLYASLAGSGKPLDATWKPGAS